MSITRSCLLFITTAILAIAGSIRPALANFTLSYSGAPFNLANCDSQILQCATGSINLTIQFSGDMPIGPYASLDASQVLSMTETVGGQTWNYPPVADQFLVFLINGQVTDWSVAVDATTNCGGSIELYTNSAGDLYEQVTCTTGAPVILGESSGIGSWSIIALPPDKALGDCGCNVGDAGAGDPISVSTGNLFEQVTDYTTAGPNPLAFVRSYNSTQSSLWKAASLGGNWRSNFDRYVTVTTNSGLQTVAAERPDGRILIFTGASGFVTGDSDVAITLTSNGSTWTLTDENDTVETYVPSASGGLQLASIVARGGYAQTLSYNGGGQVAAVRDSFGRVLTFFYTGTLLTQVTTPDGTVLSYAYGASGTNGSTPDRLASITYSSSPATSQSYVYENGALPFAMTGIIDEDGNRFATWSFDQQGRATSSQHAGGADATTITYNPDGSSTVTNALGEQEIYKFAILQGVPKIVEIDRKASTTTTAATRLFTYDTLGYLASATDWNGNLTTYVNNAAGLPIIMVEAANTPLARTTTTDWADTLNLPLSIATPGLTQSFRYNTQGNPVSRTDVAGTGKRTWTYTWRGAELVASTGPRTDVQQTTSFTYGSLGRLTGLTNALGQTTSFVRTAGNRPLSMTDPNGVVTDYTYDARQRLIQRAVITSGGTLKTHLAYDAAGNLTETLLPDGSYLTHAYDPAHRLTATADPLGNMIAYTLDPLGDRTATLVGKAGSAATWQDSTSFDVLGRAIAGRGGAGQTTQTSYDADGDTLTTMDGLSHVTTRTVDAFGRIITITDAARGVTAITYDSHDRITRIVAPNGATTSYTYDGFGRLLSRVSPDTGTTRYSYDLADNLISTQDAAGVVANHAYDALNRLVSTTYPADAAENIVLAYDQPGHGFGVGHLTSVADAAGTLSLAYDERGNELSETRVSGAVSLATAYSYDAASRVATIAYPSGTLASYVRDKAGQVTAIKAKRPGAAVSTNVLTGASYLPFGPLSAFTYGNGIADSRAYDLSYRLTSLADGSVQSLGYSYDTTNNVTAVADSLQSANNQNLTYDALYHLTGGTGAYGTFGWTYDSVGNRLTQTVLNHGSTRYTYAAHSNRLTAMTSGGQTTNIATSPSGNILSIAAASGSAVDLTYNKAERLASAEIGTSQVAAYTYDAFGRRAAKSLTSGQSLFQYSPAGFLLEETDGTGKLKTDTIYLNGVPVADVTSAAIFYLHADRLGTSQLATTSAKAIAWRAAYQPFGTNTGATGLFAQNLRFPGQYADLETGFYQNGFRDYSPAWGRYIESDPIGLKGGPNTFSYANQNPGDLIDPLGTCFNVPDLLQKIANQLYSKLGLDMFGYAVGDVQNVGNLVTSNPVAYANVFQSYNLVGSGPIDETIVDRMAAQQAGAPGGLYSPSGQ